MFVVRRHYFTCRVHGGLNNWNIIHAHEKEAKIENVQNVLQWSIFVYFSGIGISEHDVFSVKENGIVWAKWTTYRLQWPPALLINNAKLSSYENLVQCNTFICKYGTIFFIFFLCRAKWDEPHIFLGQTDCQKLAKIRKHVPMTFFCRECASVIWRSKDWTLRL
jgi:hypothetical protein